MRDEAVMDGYRNPSWSSSCLFSIPRQKDLDCVAYSGTDGDLCQL